MCVGGGVEQPICDGNSLMFNYSMNGNSLMEGGD